jgi:protein-tyrosine phosphatase
VTGTLQRVRGGLWRRVQGAPGVLDLFAPPPPAPAAAPDLAVLVVCHGNLCRSPIAEAALRRQLELVGLADRVAVASAGTAAVPGRGPDWRARACARRHGERIREQRSRRFSVLDFDTFDLIVAMDERNLRDLRSLGRDQRDRRRVRLLLDGAEVPDPAEGRPEDFERAYRAIQRGCAALVEQIRDRLA